MSGANLSEIFKKYGSLTYTGELEGYFIYNLSKGNDVGYTLLMKPIHNLNSIRENELKNSSVGLVKIQKEVFIPNEFVWKRVAKNIAEKFNVDYDESESLFWNLAKNERDVEQCIKNLGLVGISLESKIQKEIDRLSL